MDASRSSRSLRCRRCRKAGESQTGGQCSICKFIRDEEGWETLVHFYMDPKHKDAAQSRTLKSVGFQLDSQASRPRLQAAGAARQLIEESRSIFLSNLTNPVSSLAIAQQFFQKADEDSDGVVTRAQLRSWLLGMVAADAYAGLDAEAEVADVSAHAFGTSSEQEMRAAPLLARAARRQGVGIARGRSLPVLGSPPESWVQRGRDLEDRSDMSEGETSEPVSSGADSTGTLSSSSSSGEEEEESRCAALGLDPHAQVEFEQFRRAVDGLSLKTLLRTEAVRLEVPVSEEPPQERIPTLVGEVDLVRWEHEVMSCPAFQRSRACRAWERAYASGENCIWVVPEPDHDVQRVLAEGWFENRGLCLEFGCGLGYDSVAFAQAGFDVIGVDVSHTAVRAARAMARAKGVDGHVRFLCGDAYEMPSPPSPVALVWDNTLYQNAQRADKYGAKMRRYNSARYKELLLRVTQPGTLVLLNCMSSELTEGHLRLAEHGFSLPLTSAMRLAMEFVEFFEFIFFRNGIYDMNSLFIQKAAEAGYHKPSQLGGLPSWCLLMRRRPAPKTFIPKLPPEQPFLVATQLLAQDGFRQPPQPRFLRRLVEEEWGESWGDGPKSGLALEPGRDAQDAGQTGCAVALGVPDVWEGVD